MGGFPTEAWTGFSRINFPRVFLSVWTGNAYLHTSNRHNSYLPEDESPRLTWRIHRKRLQYRAAFLQSWQTLILDTPAS